MESSQLFWVGSYLRSSLASPTTLLVAAVSLFIAYGLITAVYNAYFHPLRHFPGPRLNAVTRLPHALSMLSGRDHLIKYEYAKKYGHFVRVAPNVPSVSHPDAMRVVRGHKKAGQAENGRDPAATHGFEKSLPGAPQHQHRVYRRALASGISNQAVVQQEPLFREFGDKLIQRLRDACQTNSAAVVDVSSWYNWTTFDVIGVLAFGESFGCLDNQNYHPWVANIFVNLKARVFTAQALHYGRFLAPVLIKLFLPREIVRNAQYHNKLSAEKVRKRLATDPTTPDYISAMTAENGKDQIQAFSFEEIVSHASVLTVAGSETLATTLSVATYYLATHPGIFAKAQKETFVEGPIWVINHHPELFARPFEFLPERWLPGNNGYENDMLEASMPFGYGPRGCISKNLAYGELRMLLAKMLWNFDMELPVEMKNWPRECKSYLVWDKRPLYVRLTPKENA